MPRKERPFTDAGDTTATGRTQTSRPNLQNLPVPLTPQQRENAERISKVLTDPGYIQPPREVRVCLLMSEQFLDSFMHAADLFESFKRLAVPTFIIMTLEPDAVLERSLRLFTEALRKKFSVTAVFVPGQPFGWVDPEVKLVSDGETFAPIEQVLASLGYVAPQTETSPEYVI